MGSFASASQPSRPHGASHEPVPFGKAGEAVRAVSRVLDAADEVGSMPIQERLVLELRALFDITAAVLLSVAETEGLVDVGSMDPEGNPPFGLISLSELTPVAGLLERGEPAVRVQGRAAADLARKVGVGAAVRSALLIPMRQRPPVADVIVLASEDQERFGSQEVEVARAFTEGAAIGLTLLRLSEERAAESARQAALARAAKTLNESLEPARVLLRICEEAASILRGDNAAVYLGDGRQGLRMESVYGQPAETIGTRLEVGEGLAGKAVEFDEPMLTNDYQGMPAKPVDAAFANFRGALAVPLRWDGELRGALKVGYTRPYLVTRDHLSLLETFGELAAAACRNATRHEWAVVAARTDALTGCLNHAGLQEALAQELERSRRSGRPLSLAIIDLDHFKQVNDEHGHLVGDAVLRRVGEALRRAVRPYDAVGRYGGDEFAIVAAETKEGRAAELATRVLEELAGALDDPDLPVHTVRATAGVAQWDGEESASLLLARADQALLNGKHGRGRGVANQADGSQPGVSDSR
jgi:diguanylate cyclase (GGDEF)-like protein